MLTGHSPPGRRGPADPVCYDHVPPAAAAVASPATAVTQRQHIQFPAKDAALRDDVHVLGSMVGEVLCDQGGEALLATVEADRQIELRCGKASLTLRRDGKVVVRGTHVVSASSGPNKIKGASVALN